MKMKEITGNDSEELRMARMTHETEQMLQIRGSNRDRGRGIDIAL